MLQYKWAQDGSNTITITGKLQWLFPLENTKSQNPTY